LPAACKVQNSNKKPGKSCACADGFVGSISWEGSLTTKESSCTPAPCDVEHSNKKFGFQCRCADSYTGAIKWQGPRASGHCEPAKCDVPNSNRLPGASCACSPGFKGSIHWEAAKAVGRCDPVPCEVQHSNGKPGPECACKRGYIGNIVWEGIKVSAASRCTSAKLVLQDLESKLEAKEAVRSTLIKQKISLSGANAVLNEDGFVVERCCCEEASSSTAGVAKAAACKFIRAYPADSEKAAAGLRKPSTLSMNWFRGERWICPAKFVKAEKHNELTACAVFQADRSLQLQVFVGKLEKVDEIIDSLNEEIETTKGYLA